MEEIAKFLNQAADSQCSRFVRLSYDCCIVTNRRLKYTLQLNVDSLANPNMQETQPKNTNHILIYNISQCYAALFMPLNPAADCTFEYVKNVRC